MRVKILKDVPGCVYLPGHIILGDDRQCLRLIEQGLAEYVNEPIVDEGAPLPKGKTISTHMLPPRFICGCGFVAKDEKSLSEHKKEC